MSPFGCVITAAGRGERFGSPLPKALYLIDGRAMVAHATAAIAGVPHITTIIIAAPGDQVTATEAAVSHIAHPDVRVVPGGASRTESVRAAVAAMPADLTGILVHDAARPFVPRAVIEAVIAAVVGGADAVVPGIPVVDTIKEIDESDVVVATPARSRLRAIQTPQGFRAALLRQALSTTDADATDDAQLVERLGASVLVVPGHPDALKITTAADLALAADILGRRSSNAR